MALNDPIVTCSTGTVEKTAISVIRISGLASLDLIRPLFKSDLSKIEPRKAYLFKIYDSEKLLDEVVLTFFKAPQSYNGENIVELSVHGNPLNVSRIIKTFVNLGIREAAAGEFTYRALKNNKLSMSQVEGLDILLNANSLDLVDEGLSNLNGSLQKEYLALRDVYLKLKGSIEIIIDFSDDVGEEESKQQFQTCFKEFSARLLSLKNRINVPSSHLLKPKVVFIGKTNAGKSTLFNLVIDQARSIVSEIAGTTRDYISEFYSYGEVEFQVIDTAGIRESSDVIEIEGIALSRKLFDEAFFKILVINPLDKNVKDLGEFRPDAVIFSHADLSFFEDSLSDFADLYRDSIKYWSGPIGPENQIGPIGPENQIGPIGPENQVGPIGPADCLKRQILDKYKSLLLTSPILASRQRNNINDLFKILDEVTQVIVSVDDIAIVSSEINRLDSAVSSLLGVASPDDVLHSVFSNFCIGK